jgi:hypothetical protein
LTFLQFISRKKKLPPYRKAACSTSCLFYQGQIRYLGWGASKKLQKTFFEFGMIFGVKNECTTTRKKLFVVACLLDFAINCLK